ncbi:MAG: NDP-sugar synthase [Thermoplasmata archaeon]|nr:NDP-sugar synthase [Thermoplasmata archaeon]
MKALVLVGGFGTRLRPVTYAIPKQLIPIAGKPMLYHVLDLLPEEVDGVVLASGYKADVVARFLKEHPFRLPIHCVPESTPLGTGGGMRNAGETMSDPFVLLNSDVIADVDGTALVAAHRQHGGVGTMSLAEVEDTRPYGVAALGGDDRIERFVEKPAPEDAPSHWINAGFSVWKREVLERIPRGREVSFEREIVPALIERGVFGFRFHGFWEDAGTPQRLLNAQRLLFDAKRGGTTELPEGASGRGPLAFGAGVSARGATFGPYVHLDPGVRIGRGAHVENSILMQGVDVGPGAIVSGSLLGPGVKIAAGSRVQDAVRANETPP